MSAVCARSQPPLVTSYLQRPIQQPAGTPGTIVAPRPIHNFAWGGADGKTLYVTARDRLYRIALMVEGVRP